MYNNSDNDNGNDNGYDSDNDNDNVNDNASGRRTKICKRGGSEPARLLQPFNV